MYSMVLMMALTAPAETPEFGRRGGCTGSTGCTGCNGCGGGGCASVSAGGSGGAWAGWSGGSVGRWRGGCCGGMSNWGVHGGGACWGSGYGPIQYYGFAGCYGSCYGSYTNYFSYWSQPPSTHYGYGMPMRVGPATPMAPAGDPAKPAVPAKPVADPARPVVPVVPPAKLPGDKKPEENISKAPAVATVIVNVPAGATLFANGHKTSQTTTERRFVTPALESGKVFHYVLTAETVRDGIVVSENRTVEVTAGSTSRVDFGSLAAAKAKANPTRVASNRIGE